METKRKKTNKTAIGKNLIRFSKSKPASTKVKLELKILENRW